MEKDFKKKVIKPLCIYSLAFSMLLPSVASLADLDINLGGYSVVYAETVPAPTVTKAFIGTNTISGGNVHRGKINNKPVRGTIHVTLKNGDTVKAELSVTPKSGTTWTVNLPAGVTIAEGDTVTAYQEFDGQNSPATTANAMDSLAKQNKDKLQMPSGEIWIEQTSSNIVNKDEQAEARDLFDAVNKEIAGDIKSVVFSINGTDHAYYEVTYTDGSTSGKVEASDLKIKQVTETSRGAKLNDITIVDNVIKGKLKGEGPFTDIKVQIVVKLSDADKDSFCNEKKCTVDKNSNNPVDATVNGETGEFSYTIDPNNPIEKIELGNVVGVSVKEKNKFKSCSQTTVIAPKPKKTDVKDPKKLTGDDKEKIINAIKKAYKAPDGTSKLPNGTGDYDGVPAVIQIDDSGNVKIFSGNDVKGDFDPNNNYKFVPETNEDGSYKVKENAVPTATIPAKDLLKNIKPEKPTFALSDDKKSITITPNEKDTDANSIAVSYTGKDGSTKTTTATKADDGTWSIVGEGKVVNGVITLPKDKVKGETTVTATVTDKGGIADDDTTPLTSDPGTLKIEETKADKIEALGGLDPVELKKWVGDTVEWKDGVKAKDSATEENKGKINELLKGAKFEDVTEEKRSTSNEGDFEGKIKITFDDKSELVVEKQVLYVSNHVTSVERKDKVPADAVDVEFKLGEGTKVDNTDGTEIKGNKDNPVSYQKYMVKPQTNLKECKNETLKETYYNLINSKLKAQDKYTEPVWNNGKGVVTEEFVITKENKVFTATATKTYDITFDANSGSGTKDKVTQKVNTEYELPAANTFTAPENKQFSGWQVGEDTTLKQPGAKIPITGDTVVKAIWKPIEFKATFQTEAGASGKMEEQTVSKGRKYELPKPTFTPEEGKEFAGWKVPGEAKVKKAGDEIDISGDVTLIATWKDIEYKVTFNGTEGKGSMPEKLVKKGDKYTLPENGFEAPKDKVFDGWMVGTEKKSAGDPITINGDTEVKAVWKDIEYKVTFNGTEGKGSMPEKLVKKGDKYTLPENGFEAPKDKVFDGWMVGTEKKSAGDPITINGDTEVKAVWKDIEYKVTFNGTEGKGSMPEKLVKKGDKYTLPENGFEAPKDKVFDGWMVGTEKKSAGDPITINGDTEVKAVWKDIEYKVTFNGTEGKGSMPEKLVKKGDKYTLPENGFEAPKDKVFDGWMVGTEKKSAGDPITINGDTEVKAVWKDIEYKVTFNGTEGSGKMDEKTVKKGNEYELPANGFTAPKDKEFDCWMVGTQKKAVGDKITVNADTEVKAVWKGKTTSNPSQPGGGTTPGENPGTSPENPNPQNPSQPANPTGTPPTVNENPDGSTNVTLGPGTGKVVIPTTGKNGENPIDVVVEQDDKGKWENKNNVPGVTVDPDTGKTTIPADRKVDKDHIISESKPKVKPEEPSYEEYEIPGIKVRDHYTPTFPVYVTVPKTEKVEKAEEVPVSLETHKAYIAGYEDNTLRAEGNLTRAEAAAMVTRLAGLDLSDNTMPAFKDMQKNAWYFRYINAAVKAKMLDADNGMMRPNDKITRAEFAKMLAAIDKENSSVSKFDDIKGHRYEKEINKIYGNNRIEGYEDGSFRPDAYLTRAESAAFLNRMFNRIADKEAYAGLEDKLAKFKDFDASKWYYDEMVEATNSHELTRRGKTSDKFGRVYEKWTRILPSDVK